MSKIEKMASTAEYNGISRKAFESGYIAGANAVLKEIEESLNKGMSVSEGYSEAMRVIKELKGE